MLAAIALEGVSAALIRMGLSVRGSKIEEVVEHFVRSRELRQNCRFAVDEFVAVEKRPSDDAFSELQRAIEMRNQILHSRVTKEGQYRVQRVSLADLSKSYSAVLNMYRVLVREFEERVKVDEG